VDIQLDAGTVLALTVGERPLLEAALGDDAGALLEGRGDVLGGVAPDRAPHEQRLAVLPLVRLAVEGARGGGDGEARDRDTRLGEAKLGIGGEVADDGDDGVVCHVNLSSVSWLARLRVATWLGPEVRDRREVSLPSVQWAAGSPRGATAARGPWPLGRRALGRGRSRPARRAGESARHPGPMREPRCAPARPPSPRRPPQRSARCASGWRPGARRLALRPGARRWSRCQSSRSRWSLPLRRSSRRLARTASSSSSERRSMRCSGCVLATRDPRGGEKDFSSSPISLSPTYSATPPHGQFQDGGTVASGCRGTTTSLPHFWQEETALCGAMPTT